MPTSELLAWLEGFPLRFALVKALLYEKNCQYLEALAHFFSILREFAREKRFSQRHSPKIERLVVKVCDLALAAHRKLGSAPAQPPSQALVPLVNFLEDFFAFLLQNHFWLGKAAWDAEKQVLGLLLSQGFLENVWHCLFSAGPRRIEAQRGLTSLRADRRPAVSRELSIWAMKNLQTKTSCYTGIIRNWKKQLFGTKAGARRRAVIFPKLEWTPSGARRVKVKVFRKCGHGFPLEYVQQFHLTNAEMQSDGLYALIGKEESGEDAPARPRPGLRCPVCQFPPRIAQLIRSKLLDVSSLTPTHKAKGFLKDFSSVGGVTRQAYEGRPELPPDQELFQKDRRVRAHLWPGRVRRGKGPAHGGRVGRARGAPV